MTATNGNFYEEGCNAFMNGLYESNCPYVYSCTSGRKQMWLNGFRDAQDMVLNGYKASRADSIRII